MTDWVTMPNQGKSVLPCDLFRIFERSLAKFVLKLTTSEICTCKSQNLFGVLFKVDLGYQTPAQGAEDVWRADGSGQKNQPSHVWRLPCARPWRSQRAHQRILSTSRSRTSAWLDMEPRRSFRRHPTAENSLPGDFLTSRSMRDR